VTSEKRTEVQLLICLRSPRGMQADVERSA